jgi:hypothetical protein
VPYFGRYPAEQPIPGRCIPMLLGGQSSRLQDVVLKVDFASLEIRKAEPLLRDGLDEVVPVVKLGCTSWIIECMYVQRVGYDGAD